MEKSHIIKEIDRILKEAVALETKAKLDLETAEFLNNEAIKLENVIDNPNSLPEEKELATIKLIALNKRVFIELKEATTTQEKLEKDLNAIIEGLSNEL